MWRPVFGNESAEEDELLYECAVQEGLPDKPILTGQWGTGKTAALMLPNRGLADVLCVNADSDSARTWYFTEEKLDIRALLTLRQKHASDERILVGALEDIWRAEIVRTACVLMHDLWTYYQCPRGEHWESVLRVGRTGDMRRSIWKRIPEVVSLVFGGRQRSDAATSIQDALSALFVENLFKDLQCCLQDVQYAEVLPTIAVEPIDSPQSPLENQPSLAQPLVTALLNVFRRTFQPSNRQLLNVRFSIPWHRYDKKILDDPQKLTQYLAPIRWEECNLRSFMNRRIQWEFRRVGRSLRPGDSWSTLFDSKIRNEACDPPVYEDSFQYVLRHTHHRPRDLQRVAKNAVECCARSRGIDADAVLSGRGGRVDQIALREAIDNAVNAMTEELQIEGWRRFEHLYRLMQELRGLSVPFGRNVLKRRLQRIKDICDFNTAVSVLWQAGVLGVCIVAKTPPILQEIRQILGSEAHRQYEVDRKTVHVWSLFVYSCDSDCLSVLKRFEPLGDGVASFILHPKTFKFLLAKVSRDWPIGA